MRELGYRCGLLYKAFWGEEEEKNPCSRCLFEENGEMCDQTKEEFERELFEAHGRAIEKFTEMRLRVEFKRADELFEHAKIRYYAGRTTKTAIFVRCPKCGRIGKLRSGGKTLFGDRYVIYHGRHSCSTCYFGYFSEDWEYLDEIYQKYREDERINPDFRKYECLIDDFKKWLREKGLSENTVRSTTVAVKTILRRYGLVDLAVLKERLNCTQLKRRTVEYYISCFRHFLEFLRSSLTEEEKKGKEGIECELSR